MGILTAVEIFLINHRFLVRFDFPYAEHNKSDLFKTKRSRELDFGSLGYRRSKEIKPKPKTTWKMVLGAIKQAKFKAALRTTESVNKEELRT